MWVVMDCQTAIEYINLHADGMLGDADTQRLFEHIRSCEHCKIELDKTLTLKKALSSLDELEPPAGLALGAIKKAKKRRIPVFAYASAALAAALALIAVFSSDIFPNKTLDGATGSTYFKESLVQEFASADSAPAEAPELAAAPAASLAPEEGAFGSTAQDSSTESKEMGKAPVASIVIPFEESENFREALYEFFDKYDISPEQEDDSGVLFIVPEGSLTELKAILENAGVASGELAEGSAAEFIFEK
jgi:hypothetical protein